MEPGSVLKPAFFERDARLVARDLLGCRLCRPVDGTVHRWTIRETEAYTGPEDRACHAHKGRTRRTEVMFGPPGHWYVYLCYGIHWMLNVVTGPAGHPAAVLLRGAGERLGPGRLTRALGITGDLHGALANPGSGLWMETGFRVPEARIEQTPRIGVDYAGPDWSQRPYRFVLKVDAGTAPGIRPT